MLNEGALFARNLMLPDSFWRLKIGVSGFSGPKGDELVTQALCGRSFQLKIDRDSDTLANRKVLARIKVKLMEDGYICWLDFKDVLHNAICISSWEPILKTSDEINRLIPQVLSWVRNASNQPNQYLWGGTLGPNYDCSGLVQTAFASQEIWLPRDAYQQERFCQPLSLGLDQIYLFRPGDLLFFGSSEKCNHVGIYMGSGSYWHSSGKDDGNNGIKLDDLYPRLGDSVGLHYRSLFRGIGRVCKCHDGSTLL